MLVKRKSFAKHFNSSTYYSLRLFLLLDYGMKAGIVKPSFGYVSLDAVSAVKLQKSQMDMYMLRLVQISNCS